MTSKSCVQNLFAHLQRPSTVAADGHVLLCRHQHGFNTAVALTIHHQNHQKLDSSLWPVGSSCLAFLPLVGLGALSDITLCNHVTHLHFLCLAATLAHTN